MTIRSNGVLVKSPTTIWSGSPATWQGWPSASGGLDFLGTRWVSYAAMYRENGTVAAVVDKLARATARLPLKVYERAERGRPEARDHAFARLLREPSPQIDPFTFWVWTVSTLNIFGETFWGKVRDKGGRPVELVPLHPVAVKRELQSNGTLKWSFDSGRLHIPEIRREDLVHFRFFNPDDINTGLSPLEALRAELEQDDAARRATSSFWRNGARPGVILSHKGELSPAAATRLKVGWNEVASGPDNVGKTVVLEEGMTPHFLTINSDEAQYIEIRKINRESVLIRFDVPPPVLHVLDHATYSNISEQMRSMYRDTMAPRLKHLESTIEQELRKPNFGDDVYAEFLMDEVLRGDFEVRVSSYRAAVNSGWVTPAEVREMENLPFIEGSDRLFLNSTMVPMTPVEGEEPAQVPAAEQPPAVAAPPAPMALPPARVRTHSITTQELRTVMGRLSRPKSLDDIDGQALVAGLNGSALLVLATFNESKALGLPVAALRDRLKRMGDAA